ncbi:scavenger receptor cysteine-rich type 1 protein M130-like [Larus michahellis]|uniref:scavenger receptor cysteine-rich type 1 protein M130-like n=1 Tax=Larus michahellis TaxID=119627 RepID=UPI003D9B37C1
MSMFEGAAEVKLEDGGGRCAGRVEVKHQGQWGTVCGYNWDMDDAAVVCKQLHCGSALEAPQYGHFGPGSGPIWMAYVACHGTESALSDCTDTEEIRQYCDHSLDAGVTCSAHPPSAPGAGTWCPHARGLRAAHMATHNPGPKELGARDVHPWRCSLALAQDPPQAGAGAGGWWRQRPEVTPGFVRLVGGDNPCSGRVEIHDRNEWKTVCDSDFGPKAADVVCRELQCGTALSVPGAAHFGEGSGPMWDRELQCVGNESLLSSCPTGSPRDQPCTHANAAGVTCTQFTGFRLVNGSTACEGRVEVHVQGTWGTLCASRWDLLDAHVLCRHLNCGFAESISKGGRFGRGSGPVWRDSFHCDGTEAHLGECPVTALGASPCSHENDAAVICQVRLVNGPGRCAGRVEIYYQGSWGSVCDDGWDLSDAAVVCRQLGCGGALEAVGSARFGEGSAQIWLESVNCSGAEAALWDCLAGSWGQHDCGHKEDAGVVCSEFMALRLENGTNCSGRLQVFYNGTWGSVCSNSMTPETVSLACKELGCGDRGSLETQRPHGRLSGTAWLDRVECGERNSSFWQCPSAPWHPQSCDDLRDETHITCKDREKIRAVGGEKGCSGRVEVWHRGSWGTVCDDSWDMRDAEVACRQLGCGPAVSALAEAASGEGSGPIWLEQVECRGTEPSLQDCWARPGDSGACRHKEDAAVICSDAPRTAAPTPPADPTRGRLTGSGRVSLPVIMCIILGALVCLLLALLAGSTEHKLGQQSALPSHPLGLSPGSYSEGSLSKLQPYPGDSEEEDGPWPAPDVPVLPGGDPADGYDDAREVSDPGEDPSPGQEDWEMPRVAEEGSGPTDTLGGPNLLSQRGAGAPGAEGDGWSLSPESTGYDDAEEVSVAHPPEDTEAVTPELRQGQPPCVPHLCAAAEEEKYNRPVTSGVTSGKRILREIIESVLLELNHTITEWLQLHDVFSWGWDTITVLLHCLNDASFCIWLFFGLSNGTSSSRTTAERKKAYLNNGWDTRSFVLHQNSILGMGVTLTVNSDNYGTLI